MATIKSLYTELSDEPSYWIFSFEWVSARTHHRLQVQREFPALTSQVIFIRDIERLLVGSHPRLELQLEFLGLGLGALPPASLQRT